MYVVYINLLYFLSIFLFTYNKNLLSQKKNSTICKYLNIYETSLIIIKYYDYISVIHVHIFAR